MDRKRLGVRYPCDVTGYCTPTSIPHHPESPVPFPSLFHGCKEAKMINFSFSEISLLFLRRAFAYFLGIQIRPSSINFFVRLFVCCLLACSLALSFVCFFLFNPNTADNCWKLCNTSAEKFYVFCIDILLLDCCTKIIWSEKMLKTSD